MIADQTTLFDLLSGEAPPVVVPRRSFSKTVQELNPPPPRIDTSKWAPACRGVYEVMLKWYPLWVKKSFIAKQAGIGGHAFSARKSDLKLKYGILMETRPSKDSDEQECRLLPPKCEADKLNAADIPRS